MKQLIVFCLFCQFFLNGFSQKPVFFREEITFTIDSANFYINGNYFFRNPSSKVVKQMIYFPVSGRSSIDTLVVIDSSDPSKDMRVSVKDSMASFYLELLPRTGKSILLSYRQHHDGKSARYILLSTKTWGKPLERATYHLIAGKNIRLQTFSIPPDKMEEFHDLNVWSWERQDFMPDRDMVFGFGAELGVANGE